MADKIKDSQDKNSSDINDELQQPKETSETSVVEGQAKIIFSRVEDVFYNPVN